LLCLGGIGFFVSMLKQFRDLGLLPLAPLCGLRNRADRILVELQIPFRGSRRSPQDQGIAAGNIRPCRSGAGKRRRTYYGDPEFADYLNEKASLLEVWPLVI